MIIFIVNSASTLLGVLLLLVVTLRLLFFIWRSKWIAAPPTIFPILDVIKVLVRITSFGTFVRNLYEKHKSSGFRYCRYFLSSWQLLIFDLELIKSITTKDFSHFTDHISYSNEELDPITGQPFNLKFPKWRERRIKLTPMFSSGKLKVMFQTMVDYTKELINLVDKSAKSGEVLDIQSLMERYSTDVIASCSFGVESNTLKNPKSDFRKYARMIFEFNFFQALRNLIVFQNAKILYFLRQPLNETAFIKFYVDLVREVVNYREKNNIAKVDFMHYLIQLKNLKSVTSSKPGKFNDGGSIKASEAKPITMGELTAQSFAFFSAGSEAVATALTYCFYELALNLEIQNKMRHEIKAVLSRHDDKITYNAIAEMTYTEQCVNETLRKYPSFPFLLRECTRPYRIPNSNIVLQKGAQVVIPIEAIQNDSEYFPEPEKFDPERFSQENKSKYHSCAWIPFGSGPRTCIGMRFGIIQMKVTLAALLRNYRFALNKKTKEPLVVNRKSIILVTCGGVWMDIEKIM